MNSDLLEWVKQRTWFYEFRLPDGSATRTNNPSAVAAIHTTREQHLERLIRANVKDARSLSALDLASHEGYYSIVLSRHFGQVVGVEQRAESIASAAKITELLGATNVAYRQARVEELRVEECRADFVLMYGLLYHVQDPIGMLQQVARLTRRYLCIETQVLPFDVSGRVEDGHYLWMRPIQGLFGVVQDYPDEREGGTTAFAMVPTANALTWLLGKLGFTKVSIVEPQQDDYEQFWRRQRIIVFAER